MSEIQLVPVGRVDAEVLEFLSLSLPRTTGLAARVEKITVDPGEAFIQSRRQYNSTQILARLLKLDLNEGDLILGVTSQDLCIPILTFVFGEAQLQGRAALISTHRLRQQFYGLPADERLFRERCEKEATHEIGHTFGLVHCRGYDCVMHSSNTVEEVDLKPKFFCARCEALVAGGRRT